MSYFLLPEGEFEPSVMRWTEEALFKSEATPIKFPHFLHRSFVLLRKKPQEFLEMNWGKQLNSST